MDNRQLVQEQPIGEFFAGLDLGQANDPSALAISEQILPPGLIGKPSYHFRHLERFKLGLSYPAQVEHVKARMEDLSCKGSVSLILDYTGCGRPVFDMFEQARMPCPLYGVLIHGGNTVVWDGRIVHVPKRDLVSIVQVLLQNSRLKLAEALPEAGMLVKELLNFRMRIDPITAHDSYSAWRENIHDDLVLAVALASWFAEHRKVFRIGGG